MMNEDDIDNPEPHETNTLNQGQEIVEINFQNHAVPESQRSVWSDRINLGLKVFFVALSIPWFISVIFFSIFDTKCIVFEQASVINCTQGFFISNPRGWVFAWLFMSIFSSFLLIIIIGLNHETLNYQWGKAKRIHKKGSFGSLIFLFAVSSVYYLIRLFTRSDGLSTAISVEVFLWLPVIVLVVCCLNYLPRVQWKKTRNPCCTFQWWKDCFTKNSNFFIYWLALVMYFVEITCKLAAIMLDVALDVAPLIQHKFPDKSGQFRGLLVIIIGFRLAFHARLLSFFWEKLFHGEKDLLSEPSDKLVDEPMVEDQPEAQQDGQGENIQLQEIICN